MDLKQRQLHRVTAKIQAHGGVAKPMFLSDCWAEKRVYVGSLYPAFVNCGKKARPGHLTCTWHKEREAAAQELKLRSPWC